MAERSQARSQRCCPCMKTGRCVRCQCVRNKLSCVDCWPSLSNPIRCQNLNRSPLTPIPVAKSRVRSYVESLRIPDCTHSEDSGSIGSKIGELLKFLAKPTRILRRIPRLSRPSAARKLAAIIEQVVSRNDVPSWARLLQFPRRCLRRPERGGRRWSLHGFLS